MIGYINITDKRGKALQALFLENKVVITNDKEQMKTVDFAFLGINGSTFYDCDFPAYSRVYTLIYDSKLEKRCLECKARYDYLYSDYSLVQGNTYLTTEALIGYLVRHNNTSIMHSKILIIGYGNCGKDIAKKCKALQAEISVTNRGTHYQGMVQKHGFTFVPLETLTLENFDYVINTVPSCVLTKKILKTKQDTTKIYDVASTPYGVKEEDRFKNYYILGGLPAKYAYVSAAQLLYKAIMKKEEIYDKK